MNDNWTTQRNNVSLVTELDGECVSHFRLREFANAEGLAVVHPSLLRSLEAVRRDLTEECGGEVWIIITDATRTQADLEALAARFGWIDEGGTVSRNSKHLTRHGGIAADLVAVSAATRQRIPQQSLGKVCRRYFDWVKDDYRDGHVHADNRAGGLKTTDREA